MAINEDERKFEESSTGLYVTTLKKVKSDALVPMLRSDIDSITLTLYDKESGKIINGRNEQNVLNTNNVTIAESNGKLRWYIQSVDNEIMGNVDQFGNEHESWETDWYELHIAKFELAFDTDKKKVHEVELLVKKTGKVDLSSSSSSASSSSSSSSESVSSSSSSSSPSSSSWSSERSSSSSSSSSSSPSSSSWSSASSSSSSSSS